MVTDLDDIDWAILTELQRDGRLPAEELARMVGRDEAEVTERTRRLVCSGLISGYHARIDPSKLGLCLQAMIWLDTPLAQPAPLGPLLASRPEIVECLWVASENCHILRVLVSARHQLDEIARSLSRFGKTRINVISTVQLPYRGILRQQSQQRPSTSPAAQVWALS